MGTIHAIRGTMTVQTPKTEHETHLCASGVLIAECHGFDHVANAQHIADCVNSVQRDLEAALKKHREDVRLSRSL